MNPLFLGTFVAVATILVLFSEVSITLGLLIVSAGFLIVFDGMRSLELMPESLFGKLNNFALLSILFLSSWAPQSRRRGLVLICMRH